MCCHRSMFTPTCSGDLGSENQVAKAWAKLGAKLGVHIRQCISASTLAISEKCLHCCKQVHL